MNEQQWNLFIMKYGGIDERSNNYRRKVMAFLKYKKQQPIANCTKVLEQWTEQDFDEYIKDNYNVKGDVTYKKVMTMKDNTGVPTEYIEQREFVKWLRDNKIKCASSGNGYSLDTKNNVYYMAKLKATGLSKGFPDVQVFIGKGKTLFVEMKRIKGSHTYPEQLEWCEWLNQNGYPAKICYGAEEAINFVKEHLTIK